MQIYQGIVKGLESIGVDTAFGGNGENIALVMTGGGVDKLGTAFGSVAAQRMPPSISCKQRHWRTDRPLTPAIGESRSFRPHRS